MNDNGSNIQTARRFGSAATLSLDAGAAIISEGIVAGGAAGNRAIRFRNALMNFALLRLGARSSPPHRATRLETGRAPVVPHTGLSLRRSSLPPARDAGPAIRIELAAPERKFEQRRPILELAVFFEVETRLADLRGVRPDDQRDCVRLRKMQPQNRQILGPQALRLARVRAKVPYGTQQRIAAASGRLHRGRERARVFFGEQIRWTALVFDCNKFVIVDRHHRPITRVRAPQQDSSHLGATLRNGSKPAHYVLQHALHYVQTETNRDLFSRRFPDVDSWNARNFGGAGRSHPYSSYLSLKNPNPPRRPSQRPPGTARRCFSAPAVNRSNSRSYLSRNPRRTRREHPPISPSLKSAAPPLNCRSRREPVCPTHSISQDPASLSPSRAALDANTPGLTITQIRLATNRAVRPNAQPAAREGNPPPQPTASRKTQPRFHPAAPHLTRTPPVSPSLKSAAPRTEPSGPMRAITQHPPRRPLNRRSRREPVAQPTASRKTQPRRTQTRTARRTQPQAAPSLKPATRGAKPIIQSVTACQRRTAPNSRTALVTKYSRAFRGPAAKI